MPRVLSETDASDRYRSIQCASKLVSEPRAASSSPSQTPAPAADKLSALDELSTERLRTAYLNVKHESPPAGDSELIKALAPLVK